MSQIEWEKIRCSNPTCRAHLLKPGEAMLLPFLELHGWEIQHDGEFLGPFCARCKS